MNVKKQLKRLQNSTYKPPKKPIAPRVTPPQGVPIEDNELAPMRYWVLGYTESSKRVFLGPITSGIEAEELADGLNDSEIFELKTKSRQQAVTQVRAILFKRGEPADEVIERQLHEKGLMRELSRP